MHLDDLTRDVHSRLDAIVEAREQALPAARRSIRSSANAIRAVHRGELARADELIGESRAALRAGLDAVAAHPELRSAGYLQDAQKEYAEANVTRALVAGDEVPGPTELGVEDAPYLNGIAEAIGEGRRRILDLLRVGEVDRGQEMLDTLEDLYGVLVTIDYPDAITMNLRRSTDVARSLIEKTRGDLAIAAMQQGIERALDEHARRLRSSE
ncbi:MAG: haloacid dehalogenase [Actinomycetota bacterium]|nr:haloacid dehalogenase [Actinomycetota bacterium]